MSKVYDAKNIIIKLVLTGFIFVCKFIYNFFGMSNFYFLLIGSLPEGIFNLINNIFKRKNYNF